MKIAMPQEKKEISKHGHNDSFQRYFDNYTQSALADKLTFTLSSKFDYDVLIHEEDGSTSLHIYRPYLNQAEGLIYRINTYERPPEFVIWNQDIPDGLVKALQELGTVPMKRIITEAVRRLYESVDPDYFHTNGIYGKTFWRISKS
jgi:hypothetical protein